MTQNHNEFCVISLLHLSIGFFVGFLKYPYEKSPFGWFFFGCIASHGPAGQASLSYTHAVFRGVYPGIFLKCGREIIDV